MGYSVDEYLNMLRLSKRSDQTIEGYRKVLLSYAKFLNVPLDEIHHHLSVSNLLKYAGSRKGRSDAGTKTNLSILHRYFALNGVVFDELQFNAVKHKTVTEQNDKPLELAALQKMMDLTDTHGKAMLSTLVSTGMRAGEFCKIRLSDVKDDTITIRNEVAKGKRGGNVYLTSEAREYLDAWLAERDAYLAAATKRLRPLIKSGGAKPRPVKDDRLFGITYSSLQKWFSRLYAKVDGEKGKYGDKCTVHSCRKYFRTVAGSAGGMSIDLVEGLMRHTGYLNGVYVRMTEKERREQFHAAESKLYLTRADHRIQTSELDKLRQKNASLQKQVDELMALTGKVALADGELEAIIAAAVKEQLAQFDLRRAKGSARSA